MTRSGIKDIRIEGGKLIKVLCDGTEEVVGDITGRDTPVDVPDPDEGEPPASDNACYKANGVWNVISDFADTLIQVLANNSNPLAAYQEFQSAYAGLDEDNWQLWSFLNDHWGDDVGNAWTANKSALKNDFICTMANRFDKTPRLSDAELSYIKVYDFDSTSGSLDGFLTDVLKVPEAAYYKRVAAMYAETELGDCPCGVLIPPPAADYNWAKVLDFVINDFSPEIVSIISEPEGLQGSYVPGNGYRDVFTSKANGGWRRLRINIAMGAIRDITSIDLHYDFVRGTLSEATPGSPLSNINLNLFSGGSVLRFTNTPSSGVFRWEGLLQNSSDFQVNCTCGYIETANDPVDPGGEVRYAKIIVRGLGTVPDGLTSLPDEA